MKINFLNGSRIECLESKNNIRSYRWKDSFVCVCFDENSNLTIGNPFKDKNLIPIWEVEGVIFY